MTPRYPDIRYELDGALALITLDRPARLNAWTAAMERSVRAAVAAAAADARARAIVITGAGRGFCAGADMERLQGISTAAASGDATAQAYEQEPQAFDAELVASFPGKFGYLLATPKPIIAAINGPCAGVGLVLSLFCDVRFASDEAKFTTAFAARGLIAEHGAAWLLPRLIGPAQAADLLFSARKFSGSEAERIGLVNRTFPQHQLLSEVSLYARGLCESVSPRSLAIMKAQLWKAQLQDFSESIALADREMRASFGSADFKEGIAHFVEKRAARFSGN